jgi:hypothetical protein
MAWSALGAPLAMGRNFPARLAWKPLLCQGSGHIVCVQYAETLFYGLSLDRENGFFKRFSVGAGLSRRD